MLVRRDTPHLNLDATELNGAHATFLAIDGYTPLADEADAPPPRVVLYGASAHYHMLRLVRAGASGEGAALDVSTAAAYRLPEGEAPRHVRLLRERSAGARDLGARPPPPVCRGLYYELDALSA